MEARIILNLDQVRELMTAGFALAWASFERSCVCV